MLNMHSADMFAGETRDFEYIIVRAKLADLL